LSGTIALLLVASHNLALAEQKGGGPGAKSPVDDLDRRLIRVIEQTPMTDEVIALLLRDSICFLAM
jgi:hypothetical protein